MRVGVFLRTSSDVTAGKFSISEKKKERNKKALAMQSHGKGHKEQKCRAEM